VITVSAGAMNIVRRYVERARLRPQVRIEKRFETAPGHQAQIDWSHEQPILTRSGLELPLYCFHMVLGHSRDSFCALTGSQDLVTFWACHRQAFAHFGGVPRELVYDRTKTVMKLLGLAETADELVDRAENAKLGYREFLDLVLETEVGVLEGRRYASRLKLSGLPDHKTLDDFDPPNHPGRPPVAVRLGLRLS
jgi:Integrase core domain/IstB-like ATP binding protein